MLEKVLSFKKEMSGGAKEEGEATPAKSKEEKKE